MKNTFSLLIILVGVQLYACGCVDVLAASASEQVMTENYKAADEDLSSALSDLGNAIKTGYENMNAGAIDVERLARLKREQAVSARESVFLVGVSADLTSSGNDILGKNAEANLIKAEKIVVFKAETLNKKSMLEGF